MSRQIGVGLYMDLQGDKMSGMESRENYIKSMLLNELVNGQDIEYILKSLEAEHQKLTFNYKNMYLIVTGMSKNVYTAIHHIDAFQYLKIFFEVKEHIIHYLKEKKCVFDMTLTVFGGSKKILIFLSPETECPQIDIKDISLHVHRILQKTYEEKIENFNKNQMGLTAYSNHINHWNKIEKEYNKICRYSYLNFFEAELEIIDEKKYRSLLTPFSFKKLQNSVNEVLNSILENDREAIIKNCDNLFIQKLKHTFDINLCREILIYFKISVYTYLDGILDEANSEIERIFRVDSYTTIQQLNHTLIDYFIKLANQLKSSTVSYGSITQKALIYIAVNYNKELSLDRIAEEVNVVPQYLSRVFNQQIGKSIPNYINELRINQAKVLLRNTNGKIKEIAENVGYESSHRFGQIFKSLTGVTPTEYRNFHNEVQ